MIHHNSAIQEGVLRDIVELLSDNVNGFIDPGDTDSFIGKLLNSRNTGNYFRSITKATSNLVLTFPMIVDNSVSIEHSSKVFNIHCISLINSLLKAFLLNSVPELLKCKFS